ncbi:hypothetical protein HPB50_013446 [Hyalomma asiaticum]|uniref:Uncharacterized protein n=1 Tax=Hyalomma asiaticum TaxID=266040 RepID=A0ACB7SGN8_HYAAI|nr:hypothetical protein HPB50_013446 [Hyalomma asiaticum]
MDASAFYGAPNIRNHARTRPRAVNSAVDQLFEAIMNGDVSDAELSDDEVADAQFVETETASDKEQGPTLHPAESETRHSDSNEPPPKKVKQVKWLAKAFDPGDTRCTYQPLGGSAPVEPLKYFAKYFTEDVFEDLTKYTNIYALQNTGTELSRSVQR